MVRSTLYHDATDGGRVLSRCGWASSARAAGLCALSRSHEARSAMKPGSLRWMSDTEPASPAALLALVWNASRAANTPRLAGDTTPRWRCAAPLATCPHNLSIPASRPQGLNTVPTPPLPLSYPHPPNVP